MTSPGLQASFFPVLVLAIASSVVLMEGLARQGKGFISLSSYSDVLRSGSNLCCCKMQWLIITIWCKFLIRLGGAGLIPSLVQLVFVSYFPAIRVMLG